MNSMKIVGLLTLVIILLTGIVKGNENNDGMFLVDDSKLKESADVEVDVDNVWKQNLKDSDDSVVEVEESLLLDEDRFENSVIDVEESEFNSLELDDNNVDGKSSSSLFAVYYYPNSSKISESESELVLESEDDVANITSWYKEKLEKLGMRAVSVASTNTNNNFTGRLSGSSGENSIEIEVVRKSDWVKARIVVSK